MRVKIQSYQGIIIVFLGGLILTTCGLNIFEEAMDKGSNFHSTQVGERVLNGERIYFTGTNVEGERIDFEEGPNFGGMMMGSFLTCASCHGPEGRGGYHVMHMTPMDAPDIRFTTLVEEGEEHTESESEHGDEHTGFDLEAFRMAVIEGKHPGGEPLSRLMPRWEMSEQDLEDLFEFLKTIP